MEEVKKHLFDHLNLMRRMYRMHADKITLAANKLVKSYQAGGKPLIFGNGGSYADALHFAGELEGKFYLDRRPLPVSVPNTVSLTAVGNDYGYEVTFARFVEANANPNDIVIALSTSGNSKNVVNALRVAREKKLYSIGFTGKTGGEMKGLVDLLINVPSKDTPRIQEAHEFIYHSICYRVEQEMFGKKSEK